MKPVAGTLLDRVIGGRFRLDSLLGRGGMGSVFKATDLSIHRQVAIKLLHPEVADDPVSVERMREEALSLASLRHPNVVQLYDFYSSGPDATFLVMELVEGQSLARRLDRDGPLPVKTAIDYTRQILSALGAAHDKGIIHRDIKPGNVVIVTVPMERERIKVLDFGLAKLTEVTLRRRPTATGVLLGTPPYMSPEQATGRPLDPRSDLYAAALLLYTLLAGRNPFLAAGDSAATLVRVQSVVPPQIDEVRGDVPSALAEVIAIGMAKNPNERFQSAAELVQALDWASERNADPTASPARIVAAREANVTASARETAPLSPPTPPTHARSRRAAVAVAIVALLVVLAAIAGACGLRSWSG